MKREELVVFTKTCDLILLSCSHTSRFRRIHRFVLGERLFATIGFPSAGVGKPHVARRILQQQRVEFAVGQPQQQ